MIVIFDIQCGFHGMRVLFAQNGNPGSFRSESLPYPPRVVALSSIEEENEDALSSSGASLGSEGDLDSGIGDSRTTVSSVETGRRPWHLRNETKFFNNSIAARLRNRSFNPLSEKDVAENNVKSAVNVKRSDRVFLSKFAKEAMNKSPVLSQKMNERIENGALGSIVNRTGRTGFLSKLVDNSKEEMASQPKSASLEKALPKLTARKKWDVKKLTGLKTSDDAIADRRALKAALTANTKKRYSQEPLWSRPTLSHQTTLSLKPPSKTPINVYSVSRASLGSIDSGIVVDKGNTGPQTSISSDQKQQTSAPKVRRKWGETVAQLQQRREAINDDSIGQRTLWKKPLLLLRIQTNTTPPSSPQNHPTDDQSILRGSGSLAGSADSVARSAIQSSSTNPLVNRGFLGKGAAMSTKTIRSSKALNNDAIILKTYQASKSPVIGTKGSGLQSRINIPSAGQIYDSNPLLEEKSNPVNDGKKLDAEWKPRQNLKKLQELREQLSKSNKTLSQLPKHFTSEKATKFPLFHKGFQQSIEDRQSLSGRGRGERERVNRRSR